MAWRSAPSVPERTLIEARGEEHDLLPALHRVEEPRQALEASHVGPHAAPIDLLLGALLEIEHVAVDAVATHDFQPGLRFLDRDPQVPGQGQRVAEALAAGHAEAHDGLPELGPVGREAHEHVRASRSEHRHRGEVARAEELLQEIEGGRTRLVEAARRGEAQVEEEQELAARRRLDHGRTGGGEGALRRPRVHRLEGHHAHRFACVLDLEVRSRQPRHRLAVLVGDEDRHRDQARLDSEDGKSGCLWPLLGGRCGRRNQGEQRSEGDPPRAQAFSAGFLGRQVSTGQGALRTTRSVVEPKSAWSSRPLPWEPSTMRSTGSSFARRMISAEGVP